MKIHFLVLTAIAGTSCFGQLPSATQTAIDQAARKVLAETGSTSASIAVVKDGTVAYVQAYGDAKLDPKVPARPGMRYKIGSNTKQFIATAILLLAEDGKVSLDDHVSRFVPALTRGDDITIRQLLSHTSGYQDYYPLDYVAPFIHAPPPCRGFSTFGQKKPSTSSLVRSGSTATRITLSPG